MGIENKLEKNLITRLREEKMEQETLQYITSRFGMGVYNKFEKFLSHVIWQYKKSGLFTSEQLIDIVRNSQLQNVPRVSKEIKQFLENGDDIEGLVNYLNTCFIGYKPKDGSWCYRIKTIVTDKEEVRHRMTAYYGTDWH